MLRLEPGFQLGPYEILAPLGAGAMGEVYRACDPRLKRDVAVKVLLVGGAGGSHDVRRFEQEARAAAALNHPNIVAVFDFGVADAGPYIVSELLKGETLSAALARGPIPPAVAFDLATQIAQGMAAAHHRGIVHRDLKPANIFVTTEGQAKILDFGLAKLTAGIDRPPGDSSTTTSAGTVAGAVLGTAGYMSPEQVRGEPADARSDIFSFGAILYEMLSGRRAFGGSFTVETMTAILNTEPEPLPPGTPAALDRIARRCLQKKAHQRFETAADIAFALEAVSPAPMPAESGTAPEPARGRSPSWVGVALLLAAGVAIGALATRWSGTETAVARFQPKTFDGLPITNARFMPDGQSIVYSAAARGLSPGLFIVNPNVEMPQPLGVSNAHLLSVSAKGELAVIVNARHVEQRLYKGTFARMTLGSSPRPLSEDVREADWSPDGTSLAIVKDLGNGRDRLEYPVGATLYEASGYLSDPRVSPDGSRVAVFEHPWRFDDRGWVRIIDRAGTVVTLGSEFWGLQGLAWIPDSSAVMFSGSASGGDSLQPMSARASGKEAPQVVVGVPARFIVYDMARDGRWLAVREDLSFGVRVKGPSSTNERDLSWLGSAGARAMSSDGQWLLMVDVGAGGGRDYGVVLRKTDGSQTIRLGEGNAQQLSPDGTWASAIVATPPQLLLYPTGTGDRIQIASNTIRYTSAEWFPDSRRLFVCGSEPLRAPRCYEQSLTGSPARALTPEGVVGSLAPDGRTLLLTMPDGSAQLSSTDGGDPRAVTGLRASDRRIAWSRDSRSVYVQRGRDVPAIVERVDLLDGQRSVVGELRPEGLTAIALIYVVDWVEDGRWYVYNFTSLPSTLFVVSGPTR